MEVNRGRVERQSARLSRGFIGQAELELHQLQEIRMLFHWSIVDVDVENGLQCNNRVSNIYTMLTWHDMSVVKGIKKKMLFSCHLPSALFLTQKNAHVICFRYQKYHTYFFAIGLCVSPALRNIWAHDMQSPAHLKKNTKNMWKNMGLPYDTFHSHYIHLYVMSSHIGLRTNNTKTTCTRAKQC